MCEEELPNKLNKLEIAPIIPQIKLIDRSLPVSLNPFYHETALDLAGSKSAEGIFGNVKCSCRMRRRSESVLDECRPSTSAPATLSIEHTIKNLTQFKHKNRKKVVLREPILKSLQRCLHPKHLKAFGDFPSRVTKKGISNPNGGDEHSKTCPTIEALNLDTMSSLRINSEQPSTSSKERSPSGITDFRDLIAECQSLLETNFSFNNWNESITSRKNLKNFNTIQSAENRSQRPRYCSANYHKTRVHSENSNKKRVQHGGSSSSSTSCSLQARINASSVPARTRSSSIVGTSAPCDVTIDELASYFETFVHIPKKMSSMAEMMYI